MRLSGKRIILLLIVAAIVVGGTLTAIATLFLQRRDKKIDINGWIERYRIPSSQLFADYIEKSSKMDIYSSAYMYGIHTILGKNHPLTNEYCAQLDFIANNPNTLFYAYVSNAQLNAGSRAGFLEYVQQNFQADGLLFSENDYDDDIRTLYTFYAYHIAGINHCDISGWPSSAASDKLSVLISELTEKDRWFTVASILQLQAKIAPDLNIDKIQDYYVKNVNNSLKAFADSEKIDIQEIYYLCVVKDILGEYITVSEDTENIINAFVEYYYDTLPYLYDAIYVMKSFDILEKNMSLVTEILKLIDSKYLLETGAYVLISSYSPSFGATYYGYRLLWETDATDVEPIVIDNYLEMCLVNEAYTSFSVEEWFFILKLCDIMPYSTSTIERIENIGIEFLSNAIRHNKLSVRDFFCLSILSFEGILPEQEQLKVLFREYEKDFDSSSKLYQYLLIITEYYLFGTQTHRATEIDNNSSIMELFYYNWCLVCQNARDAKDIKEIQKHLGKLYSDDGYYINEDATVITLSSIFWGYELEQSLKETEEYESNIRAHR